MAFLSSFLCSWSTITQEGDDEPPSSSANNQLLLQDEKQLDGDEDGVMVENGKQLGSDKDSVKIEKEKQLSEDDTEKVKQELLHAEIEEIRNSLCEKQRVSHEKKERKKNFDLLHQFAIENDCSMVEYSFGIASKHAKAAGISDEDLQADLGKIRDSLVKHFVSAARSATSQGSSTKMEKSFERATGFSGSDSCLFVGLVKKLKY